MRLSEASKTSLNFDVFESALDTDELSLQPLAQTRSGAMISGVTDTDNQWLAIFKDGSKAKLREEKRQFKRWRKLFPELVPQVLDFQKHGKQASLLIEFLDGCTFEALLMKAKNRQLQQAFLALQDLLLTTWAKTRRHQAVQAAHMQQLQQRLAAVQQQHPQLAIGQGQIADHKMRSLSQLLKIARQREKSLAAPFSVLIHGDFNLDNIIYDSRENSIRYIDLHRSQQSDYVQDIAVFMISNYRLPIAHPKIRRRISLVCEAIYGFARRYAMAHNDDQFEVRLLLALARSFISSTRFIADTSVAENLYFKGHYLLQTLANLDPADYPSYRLPVKELFQ